MAQLDARSPEDKRSEPISVLSAGVIGLETGGAPIRFAAQIFVFSAGAVLIVHLFLQTRLTLVELAAHAVALSMVFTLAFIGAYSLVAALWPTIRSTRLPKSAFIWAVGIFAVGIGVAISYGLNAVSAGFGKTVSAHEEVFLIPRLIPVWAIIVILLIQNEKRRLLLLELGRNPALKSGASVLQDIEASNNQNDVIRLQSGRSEFTLHPEHVAYVAAEGNYCSIHFLNAGDRTPLMVRITFSHLIDQLPSEIFAQIHRSYIANTQCIERVDISATAGAVAMSNGSKLPISRARLAEMRSKFAKKLAAPEAS